MNYFRTHHENLIHYTNFKSASTCMQYSENFLSCVVKYFSVETNTEVLTKKNKSILVLNRICFCLNMANATSLPAPPPPPKTQTRKVTNQNLT